jgi:hypothetical protein
VTQCPELSCSSISHPVTYKHNCICICNSPGGTPPNCEPPCGPKGVAACEEGKMDCAILADGGEMCVCKDLKRYPPNCESKTCTLICPPTTECVVEDGIDKCRTCLPEEQKKCFDQMKDCVIQNKTAVCVNSTCKTDVECRKYYPSLDKQIICKGGQCACNVKRYVQCRTYSGVDDSKHFFQYTSKYRVPQVACI